MRTTRSVRTTAALAACLTLAVVAAACGDSGDGGSGPTTTVDPGEAFDAGQPVSGGTLTWGLEAETDGLNPISGRFVVSGHLMASAIFDPLVTVDGDGQWVPYLAESLEPNDDFTVWTMKLRDGVTFHNGKPLTAEDVASVLNRHQDSAISQGAVYDIETVEATGPLTVEITTRVSWPTLPYTLTTQIGYIPSPDMLEVPEDARRPIGTGPFVFQSWDYGTSFKAGRNDAYWRTDDQGTQLPYLEAVEFRPIEDPAARSEALLNSDIDILITPSLSEVARLAEAPDTQLLTYSLGEETYVTLHNTKPPFDNADARMAVALATDQEAIREAMGSEYAVEANSMWAPGQPGYRDDAGQVTYDLEAAKEAVARYTAATGEPLRFELVASLNLESQKLQQLLVQQWSDAGIEAQPATLPQSELVVTFALGNYQAGISRLLGFREPDVDMFFLHSRSIDPALISFNLPRFSNAEVDAALETARSSTDAEVRDEAYATVARIMNENTPVIWLYRPTWAIAASPRVHGFGEAANGTIQTLGPKTWMATLWKS